jgi:two-component system nitrate/nitrite response regulator NarL
MRAHASAADPRGETVSILIVDDHLLFAEALRLALLDQGPFEVEVVCDGASGLARLRDGSVDVVLVDIGLPDRSGLVVGAEMLERFPGTRLIALTAMADPQLVQRSMRAGFVGYLTKDLPIATLVNAIRTVADGEVVVQRDLSGRPPSSRDDLDPVASLLAGQLTDREREVLSLLAEGASSVSIAERMGISRNTVRTHVQSILTKLGVHSRLEAAAFAVRHGLVRVGDH